MTTPAPRARMRRADRMVTDRAAIDDVLRRADVLHLAMAGEGGPYVVPVNFGYDGERIWIHCAEEGEACVDVRIVPGKECGWGARFRSVIGFGAAVQVDDPAEKSHGLAAIIEHYSGRPETVPADKVTGVAVLRIDIESITGKAYTDD
jgi:nitroimidazol reductase NimA-like FMN-containing flavoprotein (pyridoxamine 5'-phosphate oxidase superfamily)